MILFRLVYVYRILGGGGGGGGGNNHESKCSIHSLTTSNGILFPSGESLTYCVHVFTLHFAALCVS